MREILKTRLCNKANYSLEDRFINAIKQTIKSLEINDPFFLATLIAIPGFAELESLFTKVDPIRIYRESIDFQVLIGNEILDASDSEDFGSAREQEGIVIGPTTGICGGTVFKYTGDFIVGFPQESDKDFEDTLNLIKKITPSYYTKIK